jgi:hypothetical protein
MQKSQHNRINSMKRQTKISLPKAINSTIKNLNASEEEDISNNNIKNNDTIHQ